jgi:hypothetical protein
MPKIEQETEKEKNKLKDIVCVTMKDEKLRLKV